MVSSFPLWFCAPSSFPSSCSSCPLSSSPSILVSLCCFPSSSPSLVSLSRRLFERRPLTVPFRFLSVVPGGAGSVCVPFFLTANGVRLVLDGIVYGYVLLGGACRVENCWLILLCRFCRLILLCRFVMVLRRPSLCLSVCSCHCCVVCRRVAELVLLLLLVVAV